MASTLDGTREVWDHAQRTFAGAMHAVEGKGNRIPTEQFLNVCSAVEGIFGTMFMEMLANQLKADLANSANSVKQAFLKSPDKCESLEELVVHDLKHRGRHAIRADRASGTVGLLWAKRSVCFVVTYLDFLGSRPTITAAECAQATYEQVLAPYHGWLTSKFVGTVMGFAPGRDDIYAKLGLTKTEPIAAINEFVSVANPVLAEIQRLLSEHDCDFPDKV